MKKFTLSIVVACTLCVAAAVAQIAPGSSQGTQQSSPAIGGQQGRQQPGVGLPGQNDPIGQTGQDQTGNTNRNENGGEHKMKGCVQSQGGQYVLETKKGKMVALTGQDVSAHVGHEVALKGTWGSGSTPSSAGTASRGERAFNVTDVKMISDTCGGKEKHSDSSMGAGANPNGTGTGAANPGNSNPGGTGTQPPQ
jgi:hypothetical protein